MGAAGPIAILPGMDDAAPLRATRGRTGRDIAAQLVLRTANLWLGLLATVVLVRALGDDAFGQWATVLAIVGLAGSFGVGGLNNVAVGTANIPGLVPFRFGSTVCRE